MNAPHRPGWPAYVFTVLVPGVGHAYLGRWRRGVGWFLLFVVALTFLSSRALIAAFDPASPFLITVLRVDTVGYLDVAFPLAVIAVCLLDVYLLRFADRSPVRATKA